MSRHGVDGMPCPDRVFDDVGGAFLMGLVGGTVWHGIKTLRNNPRGARMRPFLHMAQFKVPSVAGGFGMWGLSFATFDCLLTRFRKSEDAWNSVMAGAATGGLLAARNGWRASLQQAVIGGVLLGMIEGLGALMGKMLAPQGPEVPPGGPMPPPPPPHGGPGGQYVPDESQVDIFGGAAAGDGDI